MRNYFNSFFDFFEFDGRPSTYFGVMVFSHGQYTDPKPNETETRIPGMNGVLHFWDGTFEDITETYSVMVRGENELDVRERLEQMRAWLLSKRQYCRLQDTLHPQYFRMGIYKGGSDVEYSDNGRMGKMTVEFQCKPQKFLKSGDEFITIPASNTQLYNDTAFEAKPLIRVYGTANALAAINIQRTVRTEIRIKIPDEGYADIDTDLGEAYCGTKNLNSSLSFEAHNTDKKFPTLVPGANYVLYASVRTLQIKPRWWTL